MRILFDDGYNVSGVDIKPESLAARTEDCLNCVSCLMMAIIYQAVDIKPESLAVRTEACLICILFDDGYMYQAVDIKPESLEVRTEACLMCILFDDGYNLSGCGYKT